jgi:hypothetical protein
MLSEAIFTLGLTMKNVRYILEKNFKSSETKIIFSESNSYRDNILSTANTEMQIHIESYKKFRKES